MRRAREPAPETPVHARARGRRSSGSRGLFLPIKVPAPAPTGKRAPSAESRATQRRCNYVEFPSCHAKK
eukprot:4975894-Pyramimonas_sp.AAC.1